MYCRFWNSHLIIPVLLLLKDMLDNTHQAVTEFRELKYVFCSGEALPLSLAKAFHQKMPSARLFNFYSSSEGTADVTCFEVNMWKTQKKNTPVFQAGSY